MPSTAEEMMELRIFLESVKERMHDLKKKTADLNSKREMLDKYTHPVITI